MNRKTILKLLGEFPRTANLNVKVHKIIEKQKYFIKKISYAVEPGERVKALLLIPKKCRQETPGIVAIHQHAGEYDLGKSEPAGLAGDKMYAYGLELCLRGFVVLCPDNLCFEDRCNKKLPNRAYEKFSFTKYLLQGSTLQAKYISDLLCGVKVLKEAKHVKKDSIGVIGHSLGGQESLWLMWYDKSIKCGVSSCGFSEIQSIVNEKINHNFSMYIPGFLKNGDMVDVVTSIAPRPFLIISGRRDRIFPIQGVKEIELKAKRAYRQLGVSDNFKALYFDGEHSFPKEMRQKAYGWLELHLK